MKSMFLISLIFILSCHSTPDENFTVNSMPFLVPTEPTEEQIEYTKKRIAVLQKLENKNSDYSKFRKIARKNFEHVLTENEKEIIDKMRNEFLSDIEEKSANYKKFIEQSSLPDSIKILFSQHAELEQNKLKNMKMGINEMMQFTMGEYRQEVKDLSLKYYLQILKIESEFSKEKKDFYQKKLAEIEMGEEKTVIQNIDGFEYYMGKSDHCMRFLLLNPEE